MEVLMKEKALELFCAVPRLHNCAQAVAAAAGDPGAVEKFQNFGGGKAPGNLCGALYAAMEAAGDDARENIKTAFCRQLGGVSCADLKGRLHVPCTVCVETAAGLLEQLRKAE